MVKSWKIPKKCFFDHIWACFGKWKSANKKQKIKFTFSGHTSPLGRPCQKKCPADYLFGFHLHMTPRLWEDVSELQKQAKSRDNVIFSALGPPRKSWGTYFHVKSKNNWGPLSSLFSILAIKMHFWPIYCYFLPPHHFSCKMAKNAF